MKVGIVGLANVGKTSLFNLLTACQAKVDLYPFTTIEKNVGIVSVPDERLKKIGEIIKPQKITFATIEFIDVAGLVKGASKGEGLGNKFLSHIREADLILHLVRAFDNQIPHLYGTIDPERDLEIVETELALADLAVVENNLAKLNKAKTTSPELKVKFELLLKIKENLERGFTELGLKKEEKEIVKEYNLFCLKPRIYVINISSEAPFELEKYRQLKLKNPFILSTALENEITWLAENEKKEWRRSLNLNEEGPVRLVEECFKKLDLIRFYTIKGEESRAWAIKKDSKIIEAAEKIHSDFAQGFIKAEVLGYEDLIAIGDYNKAKGLGKVRVEGRDYTVCDGDIILIKFRV